MVAIIRTALLVALASVGAAQTVDIFLPEYGTPGDSLVAQNLGENAGVTTYLLSCGPGIVTTVACRHRSGPGRDGGPPNCDGSLDYNTITEDSCALTVGATLLEGPSTVRFIDGQFGNPSIDCSVAGTASAVCTKTTTDYTYQTSAVLIDTISGAQFSFYHVPLTTGLTAYGSFPTLTAPGPTSTTSPASTTSSITSASPTPTTSTITPSTATSSGSQIGSSSAGSSSSSAASNSSFSSSVTTNSTATISATKGLSNATGILPVATSSGARALTQWITGAAAAAAAVVAVAAAL